MLDQRHGAALVHPVHEALHSGVDDDFGLRHCRLAVGLCALHHLGQVVHRVQVNIAESFDFGLNVARHRQIDHEHGAALALFQRPLHRTQANDGQGAGGAADHCIKLVQTIGQIPQTHHFAAKTAGQLLAALQGAVGNGNGFGVFGSKVRGAQLDHFARTHKQHLDLAEVFEQLARKAHRSGGHADAVRANLGGRTHLFGHGEGALEQLVQRGTQRTGLVRHPNGVFHLSQNLRLTQHHGIQPAGHPKRVAGHQAVFQRVGMGAQEARGHAAGLRQPVHRVFHGLLVTGAVNFCAVAGGDDGGFWAGQA